MSEIRPEPLYTGKRIRLTSIRAEDLLVYAQWTEDSAFMRLYDASPAVPRSLGRVRGTFEEDDKSSTAFVFAIRTLYSEELIGVCAIDGIQWNHRNGWISIGIGDPLHRGQGYGREAMQLLMRFAFHEINLHRLQLTVFSYNPVAQRLYEGLGYTREGVWREALCRDGAFHDVLLYSMLAPEYARLLAAQA